MSLRDIKKQKTNQALRDAIERIVAKTPKSKKLQEKLKEGKLKLNKTNVEIEADKGYGVIKYHSDIEGLIHEINNPPPIFTDQSSVEQQKLQEKLDGQELYLKNTEAKLAEKISEIKLLESVNKHLHAHCRELTSALFKLVPQEQREKLFDEMY
jgi:CRISPR/Cas system-associated protein Csx1